MQEATNGKVSHEQRGGGGAFYVEQGGERMAELTYSRADGRATLDHTRVDEELRGGGVGRELVEEAVRWARAEHIKLVPVCPYAKKVIERERSFHDVLAG